MEIQKRDFIQLVNRTREKFGVSIDKAHDMIFADEERLSRPQGRLGEGASRLGIGPANSRSLGVIMMIFLAAASLVAAYACQLDAPKAVGFGGGQAKASNIGLPPASLHFTITIESGNPMQAKIDWPGDPLTMAGKFPTISTAPGSYAFSAYSPDPCLFTETACLSQVNLVDAEGGTAKIIVTPVVLASDREARTRTPFAVVALGQCTRTDGKK